MLYFPDMENAVHCSLIMHGFHNWKWFILCSNKSFEAVSAFSSVSDKVSFYDKLLS